MPGSPDGSTATPRGHPDRGYTRRLPASAPETGGGCPGHCPDTRESPRRWGLARNIDLGGIAMFSNGNSFNGSSAYGECQTAISNPGREPFFWRLLGPNQDRGDV